MRRLLNRKNLNVGFTALALAALALGALPAPAALAGPAPAVVVRLNKGWTKFSWAPLVRGPFSFSVVYTSIDRALLTLPTRLAFAVGANVKCPARGDAQVNVKVYDFDQLLLATTYAVKCPPAPAARYPVAKGGDDYAADPHYFHGSVSVATGGAHNIVIETDLATADRLFWAFVRADAAPGVPTTDAIGSGAIALTVDNPPAGAWAGVQWFDPAAQQWTNVEGWFGPLVPSDDGRIARWVEPKDYGAGPYRWVVYDKDPHQGGTLWGVSDPFNLPRQAGDWIWTRVVKSPSPLK